MSQERKVCGSSCSNKAKTLNIKNVTLKQRLRNDSKFILSISDKKEPISAKTTQEEKKKKKK